MEIARHDGLKAALRLARCALPEGQAVTGALAQYLEEALGRSEAPVEDSDGATVATQHLLSQARAVAADLSAIEPGEPVLVTIANAPLDLATMLGIWLAGGVVVPVPANAGAFASDAAQQAPARAFG